MDCSAALQGGQGEPRQSLPLLLVCVNACSGLTPICTGTVDGYRGFAEQGLAHQHLDSFAQTADQTQNVLLDRGVSFSPAPQLIRPCKLLVSS